VVSALKSQVEIQRRMLDLWKELQEEEAGEEDLEVDLEEVPASPEAVVVSAEVEADSLAGVVALFPEAEDVVAVAGVVEEEGDEVLIWE
jgi:hypothetical protein